MHTAIQIFIGVIVLLCTGLLVRDALQPVGIKDGVLWLKYGLTFKLIAAFGLGMTFFIAADGIQRGTPIGGFVAALGFGMLALPTFALAFFWRVGIDSVGLRCVSPWRPNRLVPWSELTGVSFSNSMKQWILSTRSQGLIRVNEIVPGCPQLLSELRQRGILVEHAPTALSRGRGGNA